jgi:PAS domain S-box-containing protein
MAARFYSLCQPVITMRRGEPAMKPIRQVLLADGNPADSGPALEALTGGRFQSCGMSGDAPIEAKLQRRITGGFMVAVLLTFLMGFSSWRNARLAVDDAGWVSHTYAVMDAIELTSKHVIEVETSARTFALTGQDPLLSHYETVRRTVAAGVDALRHLAADNPNQQQRLDVLEPQVRAALDLAESMVIKRRQRHAVPGARDILETERLMDAVHATTEEMRAEEMRLLIRRTQRTETGRRLTSLIIVAGILVGAGSLALARLAVNREIDVSARGRAQVVTLNAELEQRVEQRTAALESEIAVRQRAEDVLREQAQVLDSAQVFVRDMESRVVFWPRGAERLYGFNAQEALGILSHDLFHTQFPEPLEIIEKKLLETGTWEGELIHRKRDGGIIVVSSAWVLHRDSQGRPVRILETNIDITARKQAQQRLAVQAEELARSRQELETQTLMLQSVLDSMAEGLVAADETGKFVLWNTAAEKILGMGAANLAPQGWTEHFGLFLNDTVTPFPSEQLPLVRAIRGEANTSEMFVRNHKLVEGAWIEVSAGPRKSKDGVVCGGVAAFRDITQRKADVRQIQELNDELELRVAERTAQLRAANKELEAFSYSVSHDLRAPLRHISGFSKLLTEEFGPTLDPGAQHYLDRIQAGTQKMGLLVDELLNLAKVGRHALNAHPAELNSVVADVIAILEPDIQGREVQWVIADLPLVDCDPVLVRQIFQNLLANALKFSRARAPAVIQVSHQEDTEDGQPVFMVRDNGIGFNMKYVDKLFGVFQRLHRPEDFEGTGIGLATVQRIVQKHGGRVWAEGEVDKGAAFYFTLGAGKQAGSKSNAATAGGQS